ncbi:MAG: hypothetical protein FJW23_10410 [Acidimicrobiia bacterium]|nr:hypothetical protein [Acidimicrobiia bacterium]
MRRTGCLLFALLCLPHAAGAQGFLTGPVRWTPVLSLRDVGYDTNVFDDPKVEEGDWTGTFGSQVSAVLDGARLYVTGDASLDAVYFHRFTSERAINRLANVRVALPLSRFDPFVMGNYARAQERQGYEVDLRARRGSWMGGGGVVMHLSDRGSIQVSASRERQDFDAGQTFQGLDLARQLNRTTETARLGFNYALTPLTMMAVNAAQVRTDYDRPGRDTEDLRADVMITFDPVAIIQGSAAFGYHDLKGDPPEVIPYRGFHANVNLSYVFREVTRVAGRYARDTSASIDAPYFEQSGYELEVTQELLGPLALVVRGARELLDYPGIPSRDFPAREDRVESYAGGITVQFTDTTRFVLSYEHARRLSSVPQNTYDRRRVISSFTLTLSR